MKLMIFKSDMEIKKTIFLIIFIFFSTKNIIADEKIPNDVIEPYCDGNLKDAMTDELSLQYINLQIIENKKWNKNLLKLQVNYEKKRSEKEHRGWVSNFRITDGYKKKFKAKVYVKYKNYEMCTFKAKVRLTGDLWWHIDWKKGSPISSLHVELVDGHIFNITKFKLFLKKARYGSNEVFVSNLFRELGFLSPKTFFLKAKINNVDINYIFQEDIKKELIEKAFFREGPLLEGDERFTVKLPENEKIKFKNINYAKISNNKFLKKNSLNSFIGSEALSNLNKLYFYNHYYKYNHNINDPFEDVFHLFTDRYFKKENIEILNTFESLSYALDSVHGLSMDDRRYYYDTFNKFYLPIYYDGKSLILDKKQNLDLLSGDKIENLSNESILGAKNSIELISNLNKKNFLSVLEKNGMKISLKELEDIIDKIMNRLIKLSEHEITNQDFEIKEQFYNDMLKKNSKIKFIFTNNEKRQIFICRFILKDCTKLDLNKKEYSEILYNSISQNFSELKYKLKNHDDYVFVSDYYIKDSQKFNFLNRNWNKEKLSDTTIEFIDVEILIDKKKKTISINQLSSNGKAIFIGGKLDKWKILFNGQNKKNIENERDTSTNLTGCLNFYEVEFNSTSIFSNNSLCEDSVNIIRSRGNISKVDIVNSFSDSLDVDFSDININEIKIVNSMNDCMDFSYGNYLLNDANLKNCGDKGVSIGEQSIMKINNINIERSLIGIASKDSSKTEILNGNFSKSDLCLTAYRKKIEFSGGKFFLHNISCESKKTSFQKILK